MKGLPKKKKDDLESIFFFFDKKKACPSLLVKESITSIIKLEKKRRAKVKTNLFDQLFLFHKHDVEREKKQ